MMWQDIFIIGFILVIVGIVIMIIGAVLASQKSEVKIGFGGFLWFVPFGWVNDPQMLKLILIVSGIVAILFIIFLLFELKLR